MTDVDAQNEFKDQYQLYIQRVLVPTRNEVTQLFRWRQPNYWRKYKTDERSSVPSPVQRVHSRIKRPESVLDKIYRQPTKFTGVTEDSFRSMTDTLGVRIIVYFTSQLPLIHKEILGHPGLEVSWDHPPAAYLSQDLKESLNLNLPGRVRETGYSSVHYVLRLRESSVPAEERPWFELQVRTIAEDAWAEIHHVLGYKPDKRTSFAVRKQFQIIGLLLSAIDEHFNFLSEELGRLQSEVTYEPTSLLNAENLPSVLAEYDLQCAQKEIDGLLKVLNSRGVPRVGDLKRVATDERIGRIRSAYKQELNDDPSTFDIVANLANLASMAEAADPAAEDRVIQTQIALLKNWESRHKRE